MQNAYESFTIAPNESNQRLEKLILSNFRDLVVSRHLCRLCFKRKEISVNGQIAECSRIVQEGDFVEFKINSIEARRAQSQVPVSLKWEDDYLAVIEKDPGVHMTGLLESLIFVLDGGTGILQKGKDYALINALQRAVKGLVIISKTTEARSKLISSLISGRIRQKYRVICHGQFSTMNDHKVPFEISLISVTRSTSGEGNYLSTLDVIVYKQTTNTKVPDIKDYFAQIQHPIVGNKKSTKQLKSCRNIGLMIALIEVTFPHPVTESYTKVSIEEPPKFETLRQREFRFYERKREEQLAELKSFGVNLKEKINSTCSEKDAHFPIAYMIGEKKFFDLCFYVTRNTMIPRPSTEFLVRTTLELYKEKMNLQSFSNTNCDVETERPIELIGLGLDIQGPVLEVAQNNARRHLEGFKEIDQNNISFVCEFHQGDLGELHQFPPVVNKNIDILVCNPPYLDALRPVESNDPRLYEPSEALYASEGGYEAYINLHKSLKKAFDEGKQILHNDAYLVLEIGNKMGENVRQLFTDWICVKRVSDHQGAERCLVFKR
ncbi:hypothetical protein G9A89_011439 [Geosiphon pyriformis]|nr:hypothetical protein G9A89_011439 [Geosiphon pyriformis]